MKGLNQESISRHIRFEILINTEEEMLPGQSMGESRVGEINVGVTGTLMSFKDME